MSIQKKWTSWMQKAVSELFEINEIQPRFVFKIIITNCMLLMVFTNKQYKSLSKEIEFEIHIHTNTHT